MPKEATNIGSPIKNFVSKSIAEINDALPKNYALMSNIDFDLSIVAQKTKKGQVDLKVLGLGGDVSNKSIQRVRFSIGDPKQTKQQLKTALITIKEIAEEMDKPKKRKK